MAFQVAFDKDSELIAIDHKDLRLSDKVVMAVVAKSDGSLYQDNDGADIKAYGDDNF